MWLLHAATIATKEETDNLSNAFQKFSGAIVTVGTETGNLSNAFQEFSDTIVTVGTETFPNMVGAVKGTIGTFTSSLQTLSGWFG